MAQVEITCMCMVLDRSKNKVLVQDRIKNWKGINFPGGHVEDVYENMALGNTLILNPNYGVRSKGSDRVGR